MNILAIALLLLLALATAFLAKITIGVYAGTLNVDRLERFGNKTVIVKFLKVILPVASIAVAANTLAFAYMVWTIC